MSAIAELIQKEIESLSTDATQTNVGRITTLADGVARVDGLSKVMYNEMIEFPGGVYGIALNLEEDSVGCVILGEASSLKEGDEAKTTGKLLSVPVGMGLLGRVVDAIGRPLAYYWSHSGTPPHRNPTTQTGPRTPAAQAPHHSSRRSLTP